MTVVPLWSSTGVHTYSADATKTWKDYFGFGCAKTPTDWGGMSAAQKGWKQHMYNRELHAPNNWAHWCQTAVRYGDTTKQKDGIVFGTANGQEAWYKLTGGEKYFPGDEVKQKAQGLFQESGVWGSLSPNICWQGNNWLWDEMAHEAKYYKEIELEKMEFYITDCQLSHTTLQGQNIEVTESDPDVCIIMVQCLNDIQNENYMMNLENFAGDTTKTTISLQPSWSILRPNTNYDLFNGIHSEIIPWNGGKLSFELPIGFKSSTQVIANLAKTKQDQLTYEAKNVNAMDLGKMFDIAGQKYLQRNPTLDYLWWQNPANDDRSTDVKYKSRKETAPTLMDLALDYNYYTRPAQVDYSGSNQDGNLTMLMTSNMKRELPRLPEHLLKAPGMFCKTAVNTNGVTYTLKWRYGFKAVYKLRNREWCEWGVQNSDSNYYTYGWQEPLVPTSAQRELP